MYTIDLHTHSIVSHDGGLSDRQYEKILHDGVLDFVAVTDHNEISFALNLRKKLGARVIVGEEISTSDGDLVGLFLRSKIESGLSVTETTKQIISQGGSVYVPHPFHRFEGSVSAANIEKILNLTDRVTIEVFNARVSYFMRSSLAREFAQQHNLAQAAGSDTHCVKGIGGAYTRIAGTPKSENLHTLIKNGEIVTKRAPLYSLLCPKINVIRKAFSHAATI